MLRRTRLDDDGVHKLKPKAKRYAVPDPELGGHYIRITPGGAKSFWAVARDPRGKQHWKLIGAPPMTIDDARTQAVKRIRLVRQAAAANSFEALAEEWLKRHVHKNKLRSAPSLERFLRLHIIPGFAGTNFSEVGRKEISKLLDKIEDDHGARQADYGLSIIRQICNWQATRDNHYSSPIVKGMIRHGIKRRDRILSDAELALVWQRAEGLFGNFVKLALLTAQRREKPATMKWADIEGGTWNVAAAKREKGTGEVLILPPLARAVLEDQRRVNAEQMKLANPLRVNSDNHYVFAGRGNTHFSGFSKRKAALDAVAKIAPSWCLHDLRRTARSLMAAAGVPTLHAELVLGHKQEGVAQTYDRHGYVDEKGDALLKLAHKIREIVEPAPKNVRKLRRAS